jgi:hypothetical protein
MVAALPCVAAACACAPGVRTCRPLAPPRFAAALRARTRPRPWAIKAAAHRARGGPSPDDAFSAARTAGQFGTGETALGLFTGNPATTNDLCASFAWPDGLGELPPGGPDAWTPKARCALLGSFVRHWPCVRPRVCAGTVKEEADELHGADALAPEPPRARARGGDAARAAASADFSITWSDVEAVGIVACAAAALRAGGAEACVAVDALFSVLVSQNVGLAEKLLADCGVEEAVYASLVRAGVHRALCTLIEQPQRLALPVSERASRRGEAGVVRAYLDARGTNQVGSVLRGGDEGRSAAVFDCLYLLHMCTNGRAVDGMLRAHGAEALNSMAATASEAAAAGPASAVDVAGDSSRKRGKRSKRKSKRDARADRPVHAVSESQHKNAYISMLLTCLGVSPTASRAPPADEGTAGRIIADVMTSESWRLRQRCVAELVSVAVRNGEFARRLAEDPMFIPALVATASGPSVRVQAQAACALYHVAGADVRSMYAVALSMEDSSAASSDDDDDDDGDDGKKATPPRGVAIKGSEESEFDLDAVFDGRVGPESAAFLLGVFDSQWHARRGDPVLVRSRLEAALEGGGGRLTASLLIAAGAERALVALVRDRTAATAHARIARGYAAAALAVLSRIDECRPALVAAGAVPPLVAMLEETSCALDFNSHARDVLLAAALPHNPAPMSFDGSWILHPGKPLLAEIAAAALLGLTGRACLFSSASAPWDGAPSFAEAMLRGVASNFGSFGAPDGEMSSGNEADSRAVGARRRGNARLLNVLTIDYETANMIVDVGAIPPLVVLLGRGSEVARHALAALAVAPDISTKIAELGGESALRSFGNIDSDGD